MKNVHILIAEDDPNIRDGLVDTLESEGYRATSSTDGDQTLRLFGRGKFDLVILDIMMPGKSGYDVCRTIRETDKAVPIIMLTAKSEEVDKVVGLQLGADDYVTKPFGVHELLARISAVLRRSRHAGGPGRKTADAPDEFKFGKANIDARQFRATSGKKSTDISAREVKLLQFFHAHPNEVLSRDELLNEVWGVDYFGTTRTLDQHIAQLRKKVEPRPSQPTVITTVHGVGYRYEGEREGGGMRPET
jgi:DNA-binding response OmpR family regulator